MLETNIIRRVSNPFTPLPYNLFFTRHHIFAGIFFYIYTSRESFNYSTTVPQIALVLIAHPSPTTASSLLPLIMAIPFPNPATVFLVPRGGFLQAENRDGRFRHVRFYIIRFCSSKSLHL